MHSVLSISFSLVLVGLAYGLSFLPSARLNPADADDAIVLADSEAANAGEDATTGTENTAG
jgi:hypothetical protein